ncbi:MAG TPA: hypothetical protein V6D02_11485, partial [Candidatus Obscuribacterales bacterium]
QGQARRLPNKTPRFALAPLPCNNSAKTHEPLKNLGHHGEGLSSRSTAGTWAYLTAFLMKKKPKSKSS